MTQIFRLALCAFAATALLACSPTNEEGASVSETATLSVPEIADRLIADAGRVAEMLSEVNSVETAQSVQPRLEAMGEEYATLFEQFDTQQADIGFGEITALASRLPELSEVQKSLSEEVRRIYADHPEAADVLREAFEDLGQSAPRP